MKVFYLLIILAITFNANAQTKEISRNWTSFKQSRDASFLKNKVKFKISASSKVISADSTGKAGIWVRVDNKNGETGFFNNMGDRPIRSNEWRTYVVEGEMNEDSDKINFGGLCYNNGKFYFDNFEFYIETDEGKFKKVILDNPSFETTVSENMIPNWTTGRPDRPIRVRGFTTSSSKDSAHEIFSLLIEGKGIAKDTAKIIGPVEGFEPQIGTLVTMLNNLSSRVERTVQLLNQKETDFLLDDKANSIGALIMHLAAAEAYYQVYTFENRDFNEEEKKKWEIALNLGKEAQEKFKGHDVEYYLEVYKEVRKKTIEALGKYDDNWLAEIRPGAEINNHFCWFHVMEHQSSHLGQILLLKKRFPKEKEMTRLKINTEH